MKTFNLIVAVCENFGIGLDGGLPWKLKAEMKYFSQTTKRVRNPTKRNAVIMGKRTWYEIKRPLPERLNIVLSTTLRPVDLPENVLLFTNLENAMKYLDNKGEEIENVWIIGGSGVYKEAMTSGRCHRLYITKIKSNFQCDTFFPTIPHDFKETKPDAETPLDVQEENGIQYEYKILEKQEF